MAKKLYVGTSGWMYKDWGRKFYPPDLKKGHLSFYSREFSTVEINTSFYHLPLLSTFKKWSSETPKNFIFAVKLSRYITHQLKLSESRQPLLRFLRHAREMKDKLSVILIQLPPFLRFNEALLKKFIADIKSASKIAKIYPRFALEPRHKSWMDAQEIVKKHLKKENIALVFPHSSKIPSFKPSDDNITANFTYIRFHGPSEFAASRYGSARLKPWAQRIKKWLRQNLHVYVYFNNDVHGHAIDDARTLLKLVG